MAFGIVFGAIGAAFGGLQVVAVDWNQGIRVIGPNDYNIEEFSDTVANANSVDCLSADVKAGRLRIVTGSELSVSASYIQEFWVFDCEVTSGTLFVRLSPKRNSFLPGFMWDPSGRFASPEVVITIPMNKSFHDVSITSNAAHIDVSGIKADTANFSFNAAYANATSLQCKQLYLTMNAGEVDLSNVRATDSVSIDLNAGAIYVQDSIFTNMNFNMQAGYASFEGVLKGSNSISAAAGDANFRLQQHESDLDVRCQTSVGDISVNNMHFSGLEGSGSAGSPQGSVKIFVNIEFGSIYISTFDYGDWPDSDYYDDYYNPGIPNNTDEDNEDPQDIEDIEDFEDFDEHDEPESPRNSR
jgi:hypothetical protein